MEEAASGQWFHRQMYVDLICSYLQEYGSRRDLAHALGVKEPFITYILAPAVGAAGGDAARVSPVKTPSVRRAEHIAALLCDDAGRRALLLHHITLARTAAPEGVAARRAATAAARRSKVVSAVERLRAAAAAAADPAAARAAYAGMWRQGGRAATRPDIWSQPLLYARLLLCLHEAACVLDRADLALEHARRAAMVLRDAPDVTSFRPNGTDAVHPSRGDLVLAAARAEIVALNNLNLVSSAREAALYMEQTLLPRHGERACWLPQLYRDRLTSLRKLHRFAVSEAEILHERASALVSHPVEQALLDERLAGSLVSHGTPRSLRRAAPVVERGVALASDPGSGLAALHRAQILRTAAFYAWRAGDRQQWAAHLRVCLELVEAAGLAHQRRQLERQYGATAIAMAFR